VLESLAVEELHHHEGAGVLFADVLDGANIGMIQRRSGLRLPPETSQGCWIAGQLLGKELDGDEAIKAAVFRFVNDAHSATAKSFNNAVMRDELVDHGRRDRNRRSAYLTTAWTLAIEEALVFLQS